MILVEAGERSDRAFDAKLMVAAQLAALGQVAVLDDRTMPATLDRAQKYEAAPFLADPADIEPKRLLLIGADLLCADMLVALRALRLPDQAPVHALGRFSDRQALIGVRAQLAYALAREPDLTDLAAHQKRPLLAGAVVAPLLGGSVAARPMPPRPVVALVLGPEAMDDPAVLPLLSALNHLPEFRLMVILAGKGRDIIRESRHSGLACYGYSELSPVTFAALADIAVVAGAGIPGERMAAMLAEMLGASRLVIDATTGAQIVATGAPALRGPADLGALPGYLGRTIVPNAVTLAREVGESPWLAGQRLGLLAGQVAFAAAAPEPARPARTLFLPTNGNGLGHAQRLALVATRVSGDRAFAAFPSCVPLIRARGFDCLPLVQKSDEHPESHANDLVNHLRLRRALRPGDRFVFDGGYVFDSVYRVICDYALDAVWMRRGLWQAGQIAATALDREKVFSRVIVPTEAFDDLNTDYSFGPHLHRVGPVVQLADPAAPGRDAVRAGLARRFGAEFREVIVTMLGGGVASDRSAQSQAIAALAERRKGCLNLVLVWPGSRVPPALYGWQNTRVVQTRHALTLARAADLVISAAGYNSVHELLYQQIPAIYLPQYAPYMDDQERRARAVSDRGLGVTVTAHEMLTLGREVQAWLDGGKAARLGAGFGQITLPEPGNAAAAALIAQEGPR